MPREHASSVHQLASSQSAMLAQPPGIAPLALMGWEELRAIRDAGVQIASHTATHPHLRQLDEKSWQEELRGARARLEDELQVAVRDFAYPYGTYDAEAVRFGMNRHRVGTGIPAAECAQWYACPRTGVSSAAYMSLVKDIVVVDKLTLKFVLNEPYTAFYYNLSAEAAMIPSPTA